MKIPTQPMIGGEPLMCIENVKKRIRACGGSKVFGWKVRRNGPVTVHENHVVWQDDEGRLFDVTPEFSDLEGEFLTWEWPPEVEFLPDETAAFSGREDIRPHRYVSDDPRLAKALEYLSRGDMALHRLDLDGCRYWTEKANHAARRCRIRWDCPATLDMADVVKTTLA
jgi:hypothetical protein